MTNQTASQTARSRQQRRIDHLTNDPNGPHMRRLDLLLPADAYERFESLMNNTNSRRRETIVAAIEAYYEQKIEEGVIEPPPTSAVQQRRTAQ